MRAEWVARMTSRLWQRGQTGGRSSSTGGAGRGGGAGTGADAGRVASIGTVSLTGVAHSPSSSDSDGSGSVPLVLIARVPARATAPGSVRATVGIARTETCGGGGPGATDRRRRKVPSSIGPSGVQAGTDDRTGAIARTFAAKERGTEVPRNAGGRPLGLGAPASLVARGRSARRSATRPGLPQP